MAKPGRMYIVDNKWNFVFFQACLLLPIFPFMSAQREGDVRLRGSSDHLRGRVELYHDGQWGTVCDNHWTASEAVVTCRQLGYNEGTAYRNAFFGPGTGPLWNDYIYCGGNEERLIECSYSPHTNYAQCTHLDDAGVGCLDTYTKLEVYGITLGCTVLLCLICCMVQNTCDTKKCQRRRRAQHTDCSGTGNQQVNTNTPTASTPPLAANHQTPAVSSNAVFANRFQPFPLVLEPPPSYELVMSMKAAENASHSSADLTGTALSLPVSDRNVETSVCL